MTVQVFGLGKSNTKHLIDAPKSNRIVELDGLRGLAIAAVVISHLNENLLPGGFLGVDVFFALSGFVVAMSFLRRRSSGVRLDLVDFYVRRMLRIAPALILCLVVTTFLTGLLIPDSWLSQSTQETGSFAFWGFSNIPLMHADGYFSHRSDFNPFAQTWSLAVEEQFYLIAPILLLAWQKQNWSSGFLRTLRIGFPFLTLASVVYAAFFLEIGSRNAFYSLPSRFWEIGAGVLAFLLLEKSKKIQGIFRANQGKSVLIGLILIGTAFVYGSPSITPWPMSLVPVMGSLLVIAGSFNGSSSSNALACRFVRSGSLVWLGFISYALYLWHWPVLVFMRWTIGVDSWWLICTAVFISLFMACFSTYILERPFIKWGKRVRVRMFFKLLLGFALVFGSWIFAGKVHAVRSKYSWNSVNKDSQMWTPQRVDSLGTDGAKTTLFVIGDSHAYAYGPMLKRFHEESGWNVRTLGAGMCFPVRLLDGLELSDTCMPAIDALIEKLSMESKPGDIVLLAGLRSSRLVNYWGRESLVDEWLKASEATFSGQNKNLGMEAANRFMKKVQPLNLRIVFEAPKPVLNAPLMKCSDWFNASASICGEPILRSDYLASRSKVMGQVKILRDKFNELEVWDSSAFLCPAKHCVGYEEGKPLFYDGDHLSGYGSERAYDHLSKFLDK